MVPSAVPDFSSDWDGCCRAQVSADTLGQLGKTEGEHFDEAMLDNGRGVRVGS
jgi:hypothetical protein